MTLKLYLLASAALVMAQWTSYYGVVFREASLHHVQRLLRQSCQEVLARTQRLLLLALAGEGVCLDLWRQRYCLGNMLITRPLSATPRQQPRCMCWLTASSRSSRSRSPRCWRISSNRCSRVPSRHRPWPGPCDCAKGLFVSEEVGLGLGYLWNRVRFPIILDCVPPHTNTVRFPYLIFFWTKRYSTSLIQTVLYSTIV